MAMQEYLPNYILDVPMPDSIKQPGQAGTENEIEITPAMMGAGYAVLCEVLSPEDLGDTDPFDLLRSLYLAMTSESSDQ